MPTFLARYVAGEHEQVWTDLLALGMQVRDKPFSADAISVAQETMQRVKHNISLLVPRLGALGYTFGYQWAVDRGVFTPEQAREVKQHRPLQSPPSGDPGPLLDELERRVGALPLSLRAFYEVVGGVNLVGSHPVWGGYGLDALVVESATQVIELDDWMRWSADKDTQGVCKMPIALDQHQKYFVSGNIYTVQVPVLAADVLMEGEWHSTTFVNYLRVCLRWAGLPGLERTRDISALELDVLTHDLLPL